MVGQWGPPNTFLRRVDPNAADGNSPGLLKFFYNKGADQATIVNPDNIPGNGYWAIRAFNNDGAALAIGKCYELQISGVSGKDPQVKKFVDTLSSAVLRVPVIAVNATADQTWDWFAIQGVVPFALVEGTAAVAAGNVLKIDTNGAGGVSVPIKDGAAWANATVKSLGVARAAQGAAGNVTTEIYLLGTPVQVDQA